MNHSVYHAVYNLAYSAISLRKELHL